MNPLRDIARAPVFGPLRGVIAGNYSRILQALLAYILLTVQPVVFFRSALVSKTAHIPFDIEGWHLPIASFIARCAREHILPFWNPYTACGAPVYADIQAQMFYPLTWVALLSGNVSDGHKLFFWLQALVPLHMCLGGIFLFLFVNRLGCSIPISLLAGTVYELSAFFASQAQHLAAICSAAWFPLILLCVLKLSERITARWIGITAVAVALSILAGFPQCTIVAFVSAGVLASSVGIMTRKSRVRFLVALSSGFALGVTITTVQLIPTLEAVPVTIAKLRPDWHVNGGGLPLQSLVSFLWPNFYHVFSPFSASYTLPFNFTFVYTYCGHLTVLLVAAAPVLLVVRRRSAEHKLLLTSFALLLINAVWMIGDATPVYEWIYVHLPRTIRASLYAEYALMGFSLWAAVTAALALRGLRLRHATQVAWMLALISAANLIAVSSNRAMNTAEHGYRLANSEYAIGGDTTIVNAMQHLTRTANPPLRMDFLASDFSGLRSGAGMFRIPSALGDDPFNSLRYYYFRLSFSGQRLWDRVQLLTAATSPWVNAINDGFLVSGQIPPAALPGRFEPVAVDGIHVWRNPTPLPRFYLVNRVRHAANMEEARRLLANVQDPATEAIVENLTNAWRGADLQGSSVQLASYQQNRVELRVHAAGPAYLVTSEALYPGWTATANGRPLDLLPTNLAFRGMPVQPGDTRIVMTFRPNYLTGSVVTSVFAALLALLLIACNPGLSEGSGSHRTTMKRV